MPARSRRPEILAKYVRILERNYPDQAIANAVAHELVLAAEGCGIDFDRPFLIEEPDARDWQAWKAGQPAENRADAPDLTDVREAIRAVSPAQQRRIDDAQRRFNEADQAAMDDEADR
jgi:hypothetical protein